MAERLDDLIHSEAGASHLIFRRDAGVAGVWECDLEVTAETAYLSVTVADETVGCRRASGVEVTVISPTETYASDAPAIGLVDNSIPPPVLQRTTACGYALAVVSPPAARWHVRLVSPGVAPVTLRVQALVRADDGLNHERRRRHMDLQSFPVRSAITLVQSQEVIPRDMDRCGRCRLIVGIALGGDGTACCNGSPWLGCSVSVLAATGHLYRTSRERGYRYWDRHDGGVAKGCRFTGRTR